jgi:PhoH-like ATPase
MKLFDTNAILTLQEQIFDEPFYLSSETLLELEEIKSSGKKSEDVRYAARHITKLLFEKSDNYTTIFVDLSILDIVDRYGLPHTPDNIICACAKSLELKGEDVEFISYDILANLTASKIFGLKTNKSLEYTNVDINEYKGYKTVVTTEEELVKTYEKDNCENVFDCLVNEYVVINDAEGNFCDVLKWTGSKYVAVWNKNIKSMAFGDKIKAKDIYQRMAIDSLMSNQITCISGHAGSGKSLLSLVVAMNLIETGKYDKLVVLFNPVSVKGATQLGYYSGSAIEKALQSNIGHILTSKFGDKFATENYIAQGKIKLIPMADCRGCEISDNEILWITEAENTTADLMKICLSRVSSGAKVIIEGDYEQTDDRRFDASNGLRRAVDVLCGEAEFGYVELRKVWRSRIAELVNKM